MITKIKEKISNIRQFITFGLIGVVITVLSLLIYWGCIRFGLHYQVANALGFIITVALSYILNNIFTFSDKKKIYWSIYSLLKTYASYSITGIFLAGFLLWIWNGVFGIDEKIAPILNLFFTVPINYLLNKYWVYKKQGTNIESKMQSIESELLDE